MSKYKCFLCYKEIIITQSICSECAELLSLEKIENLEIANSAYALDPNDEYSYYRLADARLACELEIKD